MLATLFLGSVTLTCLLIGLDTDETQLVLTIVFPLAEKLIN